MQRCRYRKETKYGHLYSSPQQVTDTPRAGDFMTKSIADDLPKLLTSSTASDVSTADPTLTIRKFIFVPPSSFLGSTIQPNYHCLARLKHCPP